jgi:hypothetical protein
MTLAPAVFKAETWAVGEGERCKSLDYQLTDTSPDSLDRHQSILVSTLPLAQGSASRFEWSGSVAAGTSLCYRDR